MRTKAGLIYMLITAVCAEAGLQYAVVALLTSCVYKRETER